MMKAAKGLRQMWSGHALLNQVLTKHTEKVAKWHAAVAGSCVYALSLSAIVATSLQVFLFTDTQK